MRGLAARLEKDGRPVWFGRGAAQVRRQHCSKDQGGVETTAPARAALQRPGQKLSGDFATSIPTDCSSESICLSLPVRSKHCIKLV